MQKRFLVAIVASPVVFVVAVVLHNVISALLGLEEPVFFLIAVVGAPLALAVGIVGSLAVLARRLQRRMSGGKSRPG